MRDWELARRREVVTQLEAVTRAVVVVPKDRGRTQGLGVRTGLGARAKGTLLGRSWAVRQARVCSEVTATKTYLAQHNMAAETGLDAHTADGAGAWAGAGIGTGAGLEGGGGVGGGGGRGFADGAGAGAGTGTGGGGGGGRPAAPAVSVRGGSQEVTACRRQHIEQHSVPSQPDPHSKTGCKCQGWRAHQTGRDRQSRRATARSLRPATAACRSGRSP